MELCQRCYDGSSSRPMKEEDRQRIMQVLFHTQRYDRLQVLARTMHDDVSRAYEDLKKKIEQYLSLAGAADEETLTRTIADKTARTETAKEQAGQAVRQRDAFQEEVQQAEAVASHWKAWDDARTRLQKLEEQKDTMAEMRKRRTKCNMYNNDIDIC